ncbi:MAG: response regulator [Clostridiales Family XIII bacterium]|nr:response regulator [Clostridiales Family XIII bacterium]
MKNNDNGASSVSLPTRIIQSLIVVAAVLAVFVALVHVNKAPSKANDPLFVSLYDAPAYITAGFDSSVLHEDNLETFTWQDILPAHHTNPITPASLLPKVGKSGLKEYTIAIPFKIPKTAYEQIENEPSTVPGIYLAGIGDNWEIYLNGEKLNSEMHIGENGTITSHREERGVNFPIQPQILTADANILVFHIIGDSRSELTGLGYSSPYYFGTYKNIAENPQNKLTLFFCTIYVFIGLYHLLLFLMRRSDKYNLVYGLFSITVAIYFMFRSSMVYALIQNTEITQSIEYSAFYLTSLMLVLFVDQLNFGKFQIPTKIFFGICIVLIILQVALPLHFAGKLLMFGQIFCLACLGYTVIFDVIYTFFKRFNAERAEAEDSGVKEKYAAALFSRLIDTPLGNIFITIIFVAVTVIFDVIDSRFFHSGAILTRYSFFIFTVGAAFILSKEYASNYSRAQTMNETLEAAVKERTKDLAEQVQVATLASRAKSDFLANMSHEIRTPLNAIIGMTNVGIRASDSKKKDYSMAKIDEAGTHLLGVINDILDMSKIEAGKLELASVHTNYKKAIERATTVIKFKADEKLQHLEVDIDENIPNTVLGDDQRLAQVVANILGNSIKFTPEGGHISLSARLSDEREGLCSIRVEIKDDGIGISKEQQSRLFKSFQQADTGTSRVYGGTGLGLAISKQIVEKMGGYIWIESEEGKGSKFIFTVKALRVDDDDELTGPDVRKEIHEPEPHEFAGFHALLAEDIEINAEIILTLLESTELDIEIATNGAIALEKYQANPEKYDIIFMDVQMPVMDGYTATEKIRQLELPNAKEIPIIAMTANVFREDIERSEAAGMNGHIGKPITLSDLIGVLRKYLL